MTTLTSRIWLRVSANINRVAALFTGLAADDNNPMRTQFANYVNNTVDEVDIINNCERQHGPKAIIELQPDFRNIVAYYIYHINAIYPYFDPRHTAIITPSSFLAYCLTLTYGYALLCDTNVVHGEESAYATEYKTERTRNELLQYISTAQIPYFVKNVFDHLKPSTEMIKTQLKVIFSLAAYTFNLDYGRTPPVSMYLAAHNLIASTRANMDPNDYYHLWHTTPIIDHGFVYTVANFLGINAPAANYENWFSSLNHTLFAPITARQHVARPFITPTSTSVYTAPAPPADVNPYIFLLNASPDNVNKMITFVQAFSNALIDTFPFRHNIQEIFDKFTTNTHSFNHYYSSPTLPTYHAIDLNNAAAPNPRCTAEVFCNAIHFFDTTESAPAHNLPDFPGDYPHKELLYQVQLPLTPYDPAPAYNHDTPIQFKPESHVTPNVRHLLPYSSESGRIFENLILGKLIESAEIDATSVPQPNPTNPIQVENDSFLESAIPILSVLPHTEINGNTLFKFHERTILEVNDHAIQMDMLDTSKNTLPILDPRIIGPAPDILPGFVRLNNICDIDNATLIRSYHLDRNTQAVTLHPGHRPYLWSCYRYIHRQQSWNATRSQRTYLLSNLRTMFGTNPLLVESPHLSKMLPI